MYLYYLCVFVEELMNGQYKKKCERTCRCRFNFYICFSKMITVKVIKYGTVNFQRNKVQVKSKKRCEK